MRNSNRPRKNSNERKAKMIGYFIADQANPIFIKQLLYCRYYNCTGPSRPSQIKKEKQTRNGLRLLTVFEIPLIPIDKAL